MIFIFSTKKGLSSKIIRWFLGTKFSHFAIAETNVCDAYVVDSTFNNDVSMQTLCDFKHNNKIIFAFEINTINSKESQIIFTKLCNKIHGKKYDYKGVMFLAITIFFCRKLLRIGLPKDNKWADKNTEFCSEILNYIEDDLKVYGVDFSKYSNQMITPDIAYNEFNRVGNLIKVC